MSTWAQLGVHLTRSGSTAAADLARSMDLAFVREPKERDTTNPETDIRSAAFEICYTDAVYAM